MIRRAIVAAAIATALALGLVGCQQLSSGSFTRTRAQVDVAAWTRQAVQASHASGSATKLSAFDTCRSDTGYFATTSQWRTITDIRAPGADPTAATRAIEEAFESAHWKLAMSHGLVTLTGPDDQRLRGLITIQPAGPSELAISVISPCYP